MSNSSVIGWRSNNILGKNSSKQQQGCKGCGHKWPSAKEKQGHPHAIACLCLMKFKNDAFSTAHSQMHCLLSAHFRNFLFQPYSAEESQ
jgi:hypothetical protein